MKQIFCPIIRRNSGIRKEFNLRDFLHLYRILTVFQLLVGKLWWKKSYPTYRFLHSFKVVYHFQNGPKIFLFADTFHLPEEYLCCKTNTVNDKSANFLGICCKLLKHELSLFVTELPWVCLPVLTAFVPVNLPTLTTPVLHFICSPLYPISSRYITIFVHFYVGFTLFRVLLYFIISQRCSFYTSTIFLWHAVSHSYNVMVNFAFFVFVRHTIV